MIRRILIKVLAAWTMISCGEDEVAPRSNPRFSVAYVQDINAKGAEFVANVYDFGSEEILEYGFVYSKGAEPRIGKGEVIKLVGRPENSFKLTGDHSMSKGQIYYVVAFIKTEQSIVYSEPMAFTSLGVEGFVFERIEGGPEVYYGDTLTVFGDRLSTDQSHYEIKINGAEARVTDLAKNSFKIIIPDEMGFGYPFDYDGKLVLSIKILDKRLELNSDLQFYAPVFYAADRESKYEENFSIKGRYLRDPNLTIRYPNYHTELVSNSDTLIVFKALANFGTLEPSFQVYMRGRSYEVDGSVRIEPTEIEPNQHLKIGSIYHHLLIKGTNFNATLPYSNVFVSDVEQEAQQFYVDGMASDEAKVSVYIDVVPSPRFFKVWAFNGGVKSSHYATIENTEPMLPYLRTHSFPFNAAADGRSVTWRDKGIWLADGKISEVDPKNNSGRILKAVDINRGNIASSFAVIHQDVVYFAGKENTISDTPGRFYSYNLNSGILQELPAIPSKASTPRAVFVSGGYLYFGGGFYRDEVDVHKVTEGYKFNLATQTWSTWAKKFPISDYWDFENTFVHKSQVYGLVNEVDDSGYHGTRLMRFDPSREDWTELAKYPYLGYTNGYSAMSLGDAVYVFIGEALVKIDMDSYRKRTISGISLYDRGYTGPPFFFLSEGKIYYAAYNEYLIHQIDPFYFREQ
ncbi:hypothetical protein GCM10009119_17600 [Algoriphagus jejuensis]|uniref:IPT/TIG domain-containing protein n=1 Tax=Algoriphagus jejuensis TaxID=419934 RepID=A0ABN1MZN7_9BACT